MLTDKENIEDSWNDDDDNDEIWLRVNLWPKTTGLTAYIWIVPKNENHGPRIDVRKEKEYDSDGFSISFSHTLNVIVEGDVFVDKANFDKIVKWINCNKDALLDFSEDPRESFAMIKRLQKVE